MAERAGEGGRSVGSSAHQRGKDEHPQQSSSGNLQGKFGELRNRLSQYKEEISVGESFALVEDGARARKEGRYFEACRCFSEGGEMMAKAAQLESDPKVRDLLLMKSAEVLGWALDLEEWIKSKNAKDC